MRRRYIRLLRQVNSLLKRISNSNYNIASPTSGKSCWSWVIKKAQHVSMTLAVKTICLHNPLRFSSCFAMIKRIWRQDYIFWYFERGRFKEATDTAKIGRLFIISLTPQAKNLATKLTRMNLYLFIYRSCSFPIYCSVPFVREVQCHKFQRMIFCGSFLATLLFIPKICRNIHIK